MKFGRPKLDLDIEIFKKYMKHEMKVEECMKKLQIARGTFFRRLKELRRLTNENQQ